MASFRARPPFLYPQWGHPILLAQSCWFVANPPTRVPRDILQLPLAAGSLGANVALGNSGYGAAFVGDGSASSFVDLGSTNRFLSSGTQPFTVSWIERHTGAGTNQGIVNLFPSGGTPSTKSFAIIRVSSATIGPATYGRLACGPWVAGGVLPAFLGPPVLTDNAPRVFVLVGINGCYAQTPADFSVYWDGGFQTSSNNGNSSASGATQNYFGWDNADNKFTGALDNLRVWNRVLSTTEAQSVIADPYIGCVPSEAWISVSSDTGTLKTWDSLAKANIKTFTGLAKASTKTVNGLTPQ